MNRRLSKRININLNAEFICGDISYIANIQNLSRDGIFLKSSTTTNTAIDFIPGKKHNLEFKLHSGESISLHCEIKWLHSSTIYKISTDKLLNSMGLEIIESPPEYKAIVKTME